MPSKREAAILALVAALAPTNAVIARDSDVPETIPPQGLIFVSEGDLAMEVVMSPLTYLCDQAVALEVHVVGVDEFARDTAMDELLMAVSAAITADRTLGGAAEYTEIGAPSFEAFEADGPSKVATLTATISFSTPDSPLT